MKYTVRGPMKYTAKCATCGSSDVQILAWIYPNSAEIVEWCDDQRGFCEACEEECYTKTEQQPDKEED